MTSRVFDLKRNIINKNNKKRHSVFCSASSALIVTTLCLSVLSACGSGSNKRLAVGGATYNGTQSSGSSSHAPAPVAPQSTASTQAYQPGIFQDEALFKNRCVTPRFNVTNPLSGDIYTDINGNDKDEKNWLRSWTNDTYLWYDEVADQDPNLFNGSILDYFQVLKTEATTSSGKPKDYFHFTQNTADYLQQTQSGVSYGYGIVWDSATSVRSIPRNLTVAYTQPGSPAAGKLFRGSTLLTVDGVDFINGISSQEEANTVNEALFPTIEGIDHTFVIQESGTNQSKTITLKSALVTTIPVHNVKTFDTSTGKVGYFQFNEHIATAPNYLHNAVTTLKEAQISDLILDLRYNGGGAIYVAQLLSSMIADPAIANGKVFNRSKFNDKYPDTNPLTNETISADLFGNKYSDIGFIADDPIPNLGLNRVFILTGAGTCSASELIINALNGVDIEVISIGSKTCGKPYAFYPTDNCATTYFSIQISASNAKGFGDYSEGFTPANSNITGGVRIAGCAVADDLTHPLGSIDEAQLSAALQYRDTATCPAPPAITSNTTNTENRGVASQFNVNLTQPQWKSNMVISSPVKR